MTQIMSYIVWPFLCSGAYTNMYSCEWELNMVTLIFVICHTTISCYYQPSMVVSYLLNSVWESLWIMLTLLRLKVLLHYAEIRMDIPAATTKTFTEFWPLEIHSLTCDTLCIWTDECSTGFSFSCTSRKKKKLRAMVLKVLHRYSARHATSMW